MKKKIRLGVIGVGRGRVMIDYCKQDKRVKLAAICDFWKEGLEKVKNEIGDDSIAYYENYDDMLASDIDAVILANYANEHAPFAIKALEHGKHVFSEVLPVQTLSEAVRLVEAVEKSGLIYAYAENYCYMAAPLEMKRLYRSGALGKFEYGEGEYIHNCESFWYSITYGDPDHWRNNKFASFYCTHSVGPLIHITGLRPVRVTGFELPYTDLCARLGERSGSAAIEMIELENGAFIKSIHGGLVKNSVWYSIYGSLGEAESGRESAEGSGDYNRIYTNLNHYEGEHVMKRLVSYSPVDELTEKAEGYGHGGSDFYMMWNFVGKLCGDPNADVIDVYEALDMALPGIFAYRSVLAGGVPMELPDLRDPAVRDRFRNDNACTDPKVAGDQLLPCYSKGNPEVPQEVYDRQRRQFLESLEE